MICFDLTGENLETRTDARGHSIHILVGGVDGR